MGGVSQELCLRRGPVVLTPVGGWGAGQVWALHSWRLGLLLSQGFVPTPPEVATTVQTARSARASERKPSASPLEPGEAGLEGPAGVLGPDGGCWNDLGTDLSHVTLVIPSERAPGWASCATDPRRDGSGRGEGWGRGPGSLSEPPQGRR